ncbi:beta-lactamase family protein (plasmid) [Martelella lutilitoris]|uniref:Beta-lactamase family protein n=1 Tax=Martelella lutilitoris TaxID=2583532 RepID=A0A7T7KNY2_9HYPH|nr:serine hydrolase domain-containing protein [Martelella lutilitoris]QQM33018.1 beta-lactamase family protein [Martelella lutilitoris]QRX65359.1 beta-lactamase family protein [Dysgonomonadaceae bacterium zrk40]
MSQFRASRRHFLATVSLASASLALLSTPALADMLPPSRTPGVPVPPGQIDAAVAALDGIVEDIKARSGVPGLAVAVVHGGETIYAKGFGTRDANGELPVTPDTVFQLASLSKSLGATAVARQVSRDVVSWDSRMRDLLPWFSLSDAAVSERLTIGDLYSHRSGLSDHAGDELEDLGFDRQTILERLRLQPLSPFRTSYAYTNFGLTAAAEAVAEASGMTWSELTEEALFQPLGMTRTSARFDDFMARENRATPHAKTPDGFQALYQREPDAQSPAGGISSTANDMTKWMKMMLADGGDLIRPDALQPAISPQSFSSRPRSPDERAGFYGYGFGVGTDPSGRVVLSHSGAFILGAGTYFALIPSLDVGIVVLSNAAPVGAVEAIGASFTDMVQTGSVTRDWFSGYERLFVGSYTPLGETAGKPFPRAAAAPPPASYLIGRYSHPYFGTVEVVEDAADRLVLLAGPEPKAFPLMPWDGAMMVFDIENENAPAGSRSAATFSGGPDKAETLEVELFVMNGPARFERI